MTLLANYSPNFDAIIGQQFNGLKVETWLNVSPLNDSYRDVGALLADDRYPLSPDFVTNVAKVEFGDSGMDKFGRRVTGKIVIPYDGSYRWAVSANNNAWVMIDGKKVCEVDGYDRYTSLNQFLLYDSQVSQSIEYKRGQVLSVEILHKEDGAGDVLSLGWETPSIVGINGFVVVPESAFFGGPLVPLP